MADTNTTDKYVVLSTLKEYNEQIKTWYYSKSETDAAILKAKTALEEEIGNCYTKDEADSAISTAVNNMQETIEDELGTQVTMTLSDSGVLTIKEI